MHRERTSLSSGTEPRWRTLAVLALAGFASLALSSCGQQGFCLECQVEDREFYESTSLVVRPGSARLRAGDTQSAEVLLVFGNPDTRSNAPPYELRNISVVTPLPSGIAATLDGQDSVTDLAGRIRFCRPDELPPEFAGRPGNFQCGRFLLSVTAQTDALESREVVLSAQWTREGSATVIELLGTLAVLSADTVGFDLAVGAAAGGSYAVRTTLPVSIAHRGTAEPPVTLRFDPGSSGITGRFEPNPAPGPTASLVLDIPARYAGGETVPLRIAGSSGSFEASRDFRLRIEPLVAMTVTPPHAVVAYDAPLNVQVDLAFSETGPFAAAPPPITLSHGPLPPGATAQFLPDATPAAFGAGRTVSRTLRITGALEAYVSGGLEIAATLGGITDLAGQSPVVRWNMSLQFAGAPQWEYLENGASYLLTEAEVVGIAMQATNRPAIAWLEGRAGHPPTAATPTAPASPGTPGTRKVYVKRFDGTAFVASPSPGQANALVAPSNDIDEARFALTAAEVAKVAFTFDDGAGLGLGSAGTSWTIDRIATPGAPARVRSPRVAAVGETVAVSYLVEADGPTARSDLFVTRAVGAGVQTVLAGPHPGGSMQRDPAGRVLRGTPALAMRANGHPVVAWIEQPADPLQASALWLRAFDGTGWGPAIAVPVTPMLTLASAPVQLAVEASGTVVVAWLEGDPARLKVSRCDLASATCTAQANTGNGQGSLNVSTAQPARDHGLALDSLGRIVVAWTEGGVRPQLRVKRQNADTTWSQIGPVIDLQTTRTPRIVGDANALLYLTYTRFYGGDDLLAPLPETDIFVVRWPHP
jgi:hypothetical protein